MADGRTRRRLLACCGVCLATAGCSVVSGPETPTRTLTPLDIPDPVVVTVGSGGRLRFEPGDDVPLRVTTGRPVRFVWRSDDHNIEVIDQPAGADWSGTPGDRSETYDEGYVHEHTFEVPGRYRYECSPHAPTSRAEIEVVDVPGTVTSTPTPVPAGTVVDGSAVVAVGPGGNLVFEPGEDPPLRVTPGTTVRFVWRSNNHNIMVGDQPAGADWTGTEGGKTRTYDEGHVHRHTFEVAGEYEYHCFPHKPGMAGRIVVVP